MVIRYSLRNQSLYWAFSCTHGHLEADLKIQFFRWGFARCLPFVQTVNLNFNQWSVLNLSDPLTVEMDKSMGIWASLDLELKGSWISLLTLLCFSNLIIRKTKLLCSYNKVLQLFWSTIHLNIELLWLLHWAVLAHFYFYLLHDVIRIMTG